MNKELIPLEGTGISLAPRGANIPDNLTFEQAEGAVAILARLGSTSKWALADVISASIGNWGEMYIQLIEATQMSKGSLANIFSTWRKFPTQDSRLWDLSFSHYTAVAVDYIDDETRAMILQQAEDRGLSRDMVREIVKNYGPEVITQVFSKEAFITRLNHLVDWAESNGAPDELLQAIREMLSDFKQEHNWEFPEYSHEDD